MTSVDDIQHFLVSRDPKLQKTTVREFGTDYDAAQDAYQKAERQAWGTNLDVVLLSSDSLETIKRTHSSYFGRRSLDELLAASKKGTADTDPSKRRNQSAQKTTAAFPSSQYIKRRLI